MAPQASHPQQGTGMISPDNLSILFASTNRGKFREVEEVARSFGINLVSPLDLTGSDYRRFGLTAPLAPPPEVEENADTYIGNAKLKADAYFEWSGIPSLSDDTGLEVDALNGAPGLYSARYGGPGCTPETNIDRLLGNLQNQTSRSARFYCVLYLRFDPSNSLTAEATLEGEILRERRGGGGFGYDSVFKVQGSESTLAELKSSGEVVDTHRIIACRKLFSCLDTEV
jgi:XTP/dITP diphosphohydrolase